MENLLQLFVFVGQTFLCFYASIFHSKIDSLEEYSLATDLATSSTCLSPNITQKFSFLAFFYG